MINRQQTRATYRTGSSTRQAFNLTQLNDYMNPAVHIFAYTAIDHALQPGNTAAIRLFC